MKSKFYNVAFTLLSLFFVNNVAIARCSDCCEYGVKVICSGGKVACKDGSALNPKCQNCLTCNKVYHDKCKRKFSEECFTGDKSIEEIKDLILKKACTKNCSKKKIKNNGLFKAILSNEPIPFKDLYVVETVPLKQVWEYGGRRWSREQREKYLFDEESWLIMSYSQMRYYESNSKSPEVKPYSKIASCTVGTLVLKHMEKYNLVVEDKFRKALYEECDEAEVYYKKLFPKK